MGNLLDRIDGPEKLHGLSVEELNALAAEIREARNRGAGRLVFVIGGSLGIGANALARADDQMSMSRMTFPHQLAKVMLLEQLYRAEKINAGERYHK